MNPYQVMPATLFEDGRPVEVFAVVVEEACAACGSHRRAWLFESLTTALEAREVFGLFGHALLDEHGMS